MDPFLIEVRELVTHSENGTRLKKRDQYWRRIGQIDHYLRLNLVLRFNDVSSWRIRTISGTDQSKLLAPGRGIIVWYRGLSEPLLSGPLESIERYWDDTNPGTGSTDFIGSCDNHVLRDHIWTPTSEYPVGSPNYVGRFGRDQDRQSDYSFARLLHAIPSYQFGPLNEIEKYGVAYTSGGSTFRRAGDTEGYRTLPAYDLPTTTEQGTTGGGPHRDEWPRISFQTRMDNLLTVLQEKAATAVNQAGTITPCGFRFVWDEATGKVAPRLWYPSPESNAPALSFSPSLGNLRRYQYTLRSPGTNKAFYGFDGEGRNRNFHFFNADGFNPETGSAPAAATNEWGTWREEFLDRRDLKAPASTTDPEERTQMLAQIEQARREFWEESRARAALSMEVIDTEECVFGRDYWLGDYAQVEIDGDTLTDIIREVSLVAEEGRLTITPVVGTGDASETPDIYRQVRRLWSHLNSMKSMNER